MKKKTLSSLFTCAVAICLAFSATAFSLDSEYAMMEEANLTTAEDDEVSAAENIEAVSAVGRFETMEPKMNILGARAVGDMGYIAEPDNVNFRTGPGTDYTSLGVLSPGTTIYATRYDPKGWYHVEIYGGPNVLKSGWVHWFYIVWTP